MGPHYGVPWYRTILKYLDDDRHEVAMGALANEWHYLAREWPKVAGWA